MGKTANASLHHKYMNNREVYNNSWGTFNGRKILFDSTTKLCLAVFSLNTYFTFNTCIEMVIQVSKCISY